jgi:hypothetical protein
MLMPGIFEGEAKGGRMVVGVETYSHQKGMEARIDKMFAGDKLAAGILVVGLWITVFFVMLAVRGFMPSGQVELVCWIGAAVLLLFNTASIVAMLKHYGQDKAHIYAVDIRHLDAGH